MPAAKKAARLPATAKAPAKKATAAKKPAARRVKPRAKKPEPPEIGRVGEALERDLKEIAKLDKALAQSALAEAARVVARALDDEKTSVAAKLTCSRELRETLNKLRELAPDEQEGDGIDDVRRRRAERLAGRAAA